MVHLPDEVQWVKASTFSWTHDHAGFFYSRYPAPAAVADLGTEVQANRNHQLWYHRLGTAQAEDVFVFATPEHPTYYIGGSVTDDGGYLLITVEEGCDPVNKLYWADLQALGPQGVRAGALPAVVRLVDSFVGKFDYVANNGSVFTLFTNLGAPKGRLLRVDVAGAAAAQPPGSWEELLPEGPHVLEWAAAAAGDAMVVSYLQDARTALKARPHPQP